ncbi:hypothetical protein [Luteolibacter sp. AS25]|uniref:hypothetical protein n=1 Tax=Luteolibacter sp. AS25 TaxID=3135776 RepID=UPI00398B6C31
MTRFLSIASCLLLSGLALGEYAVGEDYNIAREPSSWSDPDMRRLEYQLLYLMQTDMDLKQLSRSRPQGLTRQQTINLSRAIGNIDEVLVSTYPGAIAHFKKQRNPALLKMMLAHYFLYIKSANEAWPPTIAKLAELDPQLASNVAEEVKNKRQELKQDPVALAKPSE